MDQSGSGGIVQGIRESGISLSQASRTTSMNTLIIWNVSKAREKNPRINLKTAIRAALDRLEQSAHDVDYNNMISRYPEERHLVCAILAWQQLGHHGADSLYKFVETKLRNENGSPESESEEKTRSSIQAMEPNYQPGSNWRKVFKSVDATSLESSSLIGPVLKLPIEPKIVMRMDTPGSQQPCKKYSKNKNDTKSKIDAACCLDSACVERLSALENATAELRTRACRLARREAERAELLERAEAAWRDLELGYQRRLRLGQEKEDDIMKQTKKLVDDRGSFKSTCTSMIRQLKDRANVVEREKDKLRVIEKDMCARACTRLQLCEESANTDALLAEHQCRAAQLDRDLQFKEEQARRRLMSLESSLDSTETLTHEVERALRAELGALRDQIAKVSNEVLQEDDKKERTNKALEELRAEKFGMIEDLDGCKKMCDGRMQGAVEQLKKKREELAKLKEIVVECRCKFPTDATVEAKRTASLAALCKCSPHDQALDSCSCTSLRTSLLSNLLSDLFGGLQSELGGTGTQMPCQLLKCLEDKHNWDRSSVVKSNLRNYFSQLLMGELDIAIATSIEKYHAKWVGASCADAKKPVCCGQSQGWQQCALEYRAQRMATKLADQLLQGKVQQPAIRTKDIPVPSGAAPSQNKPPTCCPPPAVYQCIVNSSNRKEVAKPESLSPPPYLQQTLKDVTQLKVQVENLNKDFIKKQDLKIMEEKLEKLLKNAPCNYQTTTAPLLDPAARDHRPLITSQHLKSRACSPLSSDVNKTNVKPDLRRPNIWNHNRLGISSKTYRGLGQQYAVNMCLCKPSKIPPKVLVSNKVHKNKEKIKTSWKPSMIDGDVAQISNIIKTKPETKLSSNMFFSNVLQEYPQSLCNNNYACFHKKPSTSSIDKLLETLAKWKCELVDSPKQNKIKNVPCKPVTMSTKLSHVQQRNIMKEANYKTSIASKHTANITSKSKKKVKECTSSNNGTDVPKLTESVYIRAINLEGSNEIAATTNNSCHNVMHINRHDSPNVPIKCNNMDKCDCVTKINIPSIDNLLPEKELDIKPKNSKKSITYAISKHNRETIDKATSDISRIVKNSQLFLEDCDYNIKFLGVTLSNDIFKNCSRLKTIGIKTDNELIDHHEYPKSKHDTDNTSINLPVAKINEDISNDFIDQADVSKRPIEFNECAKVVGSKPSDKTPLSSDKEEKLNRGDMMNRDSCICCNVESENRKDLEENAFHLLEEHLKRKLEDFKLTFCKSECIPSTDEKKIFDAILKRVKKIISDSANMINCKCSETYQADGSWNRAYILLQEYLKTKIDRVKCQCSSATENKNELLPSILDNINSLIENDLQRLKDICKCKQNELINIKGTELDINSTMCKTELYDYIKNINKAPILKNLTIPNIDLIHNHNTENININNKLQDLKRTASNKSVNLTQNISSQVHGVLTTESKACDAIENNNNNNIEVQTDKNTTVLIVDGSNDPKSGFELNIKSHSKHIDSDLIANQNREFYSSSQFATTPTDINHTTSLSKHDELNIFCLHNKVNKTFQDKEDDIITDKTVHSLSFNYIGYTVDCSCDGTLGCFCRKSTLQEIDDKININNMWTRIAGQKAMAHDVSYILENIADKNSKKLNYTQLIDDLFPNCVKKAIHESNRNLHASKVCVTELNESGMQLINSKENVNTSDKFTTNTMPLESECIDCEDCHDCLDRLPSLPQRKSESLNVLDPNKFNGSLFYSLDTLMQKEQSLTTIARDSTRLFDHSSPTCNCKMVPICHVKMLVNNIADKLACSKCVCDSMNSNVCPVHNRSRSYH